MTEEALRSLLLRKFFNDKFLSDMHIMQMRRVIDNCVELARELEFIEVEHGVNCADSCCTKMG